MTVIRIIVALLLLPWLLLLGGAVAFIQIIDGSFFEGGDWE
jgi:hypothetical protein